MRTDHLGDMLLTLPMATAIKTALPACRVSVLASPLNAEAARHHPHVDEVVLDAQEAKGSNLQGVNELGRRLRARQCDAAVVVHATPRLALAACLGRIPIRVGTAYRAYSLLFNRRVRQHRRASNKHEAELNVELLQALGIRAVAPPRALWRVEAQDRDSVAELLRSFGIETKSFVVLHPGSAGSSMNWAPQQYAELGCALAGAGVRVVVSGGPTETALTHQVVTAIGAGAIGANAVDLGGRLTLPQLAALLEQATAFVGSSTGPTHLAAAVGTPVVGLYPPLRSTLPQRWRPLGDDVTILQPEVGQICAKCLRERCQFFHCMEKHLDVDTVAAAVKRIVANR